MVSVNFAAARAAVVRFARDVAALPPMPSEFLDCTESDQSVLRLMATDWIYGQSLPRSEDVWLALRPFSDFKRINDSAQQLAMARRRAALLKLLVRLAASEPFAWNAAMDCGAERGTGVKRDSRKSFWFDLLSDLCPDTKEDEYQDLQRYLIVLSRAPPPSLRFLLRIDIEPSDVDLPSLLEEFLLSTETDEELDSEVDSVLTLCGLGETNIAVKLSRDVELCISFPLDPFPDPLMTKLLDVVMRADATPMNRREIRFRVKSLRFGQQGAVPSDGARVLANRLGELAWLTHLELGAFDQLKPAAANDFLVPVTHLRQPFHLRRLTLGSGANFACIASAFRNARDCTVTEVDLVYNPTPENAAWLAFAFFHVDSKSPVTSLRLRAATDKETGQQLPFHLSQEWFSAFQRALRSSKATQDILSTDNTADDADYDALTRHFVKLRRETSIFRTLSMGLEPLCV